MAIQYVAFLRAINVGGRVVKMTDLSAIFKKLGFDDVATFIASGNVVFLSAARHPQKVERQIEQGLASALGYPVTTFVRTTVEVAAVAANQPFSKKVRDEGTLFVGFLPDAPPSDLVKSLLRLRTPTDDLRVENREVYWLRRTSLTDSAISGALIEKTLKMPTTIRNINTVKRLAAKYPPG